MGRDMHLTVVQDTRGDALGKTAKDADAASVSIGKLGSKLGSTANDSGHLDTQIDTLRTHIVQLGQEYDRTGNRDLFKNLRQDRGELGRLQKIRKELDGLTDAGSDAGRGLIRGLGDALGAVPSQIKGAAIAIGATAAVSLAPMLGAIVAGAVVGGVGIGGLAGGIAAASSDARVKSAASDFAASVSEEFAASGKSFVQPVIDSLDILEQGFRDLNLGDTFQRVAPYVTKLADAVVGFAQRAMPGFNAALDAAGPALDVLAVELPKIGAALGNNIAKIAESEGALDGLRAILAMVAGTLELTGNVVTGLSDAFHWLGVTSQAVGESVTDYLGTFEAWIPGIQGLHNSISGLGNGSETAGMKIIKVGGDINAVGGSATDAATDMDKLTASFAPLLAAFDLTMNKALGLEHAQDAVKTATARLKEQIDQQREAHEKGAGGFNRHTTAGAANARQLEVVLSAQANLVTQNAANGRSSDALIAKIYAQARSLGATHKEASDLIGPLVTLNNSIRALPTHKDITIRTNYISTGTPSGSVYNSQVPAQARAIGGPVKAGQAYVVGDAGRPELFVSGSDGYVYPDVPSGMPGGARGGGGGMTYRPLVLAGGGVAQIVFEWLQNEIRTQYGGSVVAALEP